MQFLPKIRNRIYSSLLFGWFGPIGVATLYYSVLMREKSGMEEVWIIPSLIVVASTVVNGLTGVPLEKIYHRRGSRAKEFIKKDSETD